MKVRVYFKRYERPWCGGRARLKVDLLDQVEERDIVRMLIEGRPRTQRKQIAPWHAQLVIDIETRPTIVNYIFGLGGRDTNPRDLRRIYEELLKINKTGQVDRLVDYLG